MKHTVKTVAAIAILGAASFGIATSSFATTQLVPLQPANQFSKPIPLQAMPNQQRPILLKRVVRIIHVRRHPSPWRLGLKQNKHLNPQEAKVLVKAALLMQNRHDLKVGNITDQKAFRNLVFYKVQILNKNNKMMSDVIVNSATGKIRPVRLIRK